MKLDLLAASLEHAEEKFDWYTLERGNAIELNHRTHKDRKLVKGDTFGIRPITKGRFYVILPDMYHVDFVIDSRAGERALKNSKKVRRPNLNIKKGVRANRVATGTRINARTDFDHRRFKPEKGVPSERKHGIDFKNYQWRVFDTKHVVKGNKRTMTFQKGHTVGVRFIKQATGGIVVTTEGLAMSVQPEVYDKLVTKTRIVQQNRWPKGKLPAKTVVDFWTQERDTDRRLAQEERRRSREQEKAEKLEAKRKAEEEAQAKAERQRLAREEARRRVGQRPRVIDNKVHTREDSERAYKDYALEGIDTDVEDTGLDEEIDLFEEPKVDDKPKEIKGATEKPATDVTDALGEAVEKVKETVKKSSVRDVLGSDDDADELDDEEGFDVDPDEEDMEEDFEDDGTEDEDSSAGGEDVGGADEAEAEDSEDSEESDGGGDSEDFETDPEESEDDESESESDDGEGGEEDPDGDSAESEDTDTDDTGDGGEDAESDEDATSDDGTEPDADAVDADAESDETDDSDEDQEEDDDSDVEVTDDDFEDTGEEDDDAAAAEEELPEASTKETVEEPEEGAVLKFKKDTTDQRDFLILDVRPHPANDSITVYKVYDITNSPDNYHNVRVASGKSILDVAEVSRTLKPKEFARYLSESEDLKPTKEPITS